MSKSTKKLNLTAKTIAEDMAENGATVEVALGKLGLDPKKGLTKATRNDILESFRDIVKRGGGLTGEQTAEILRAGRMVALQQALAKGDMYEFRQISNEIASDPATGMTKASSVEVMINFDKGMEELFKKPVHDIFPIEDMPVEDETKKEKD